MQSLRLTLFIGSLRSVTNHSFYRHSFLTLMCLCVCLHTNVYAIKACESSATHVYTFVHVPSYFLACVRVPAFDVKAKKENQCGKIFLQTFVSLYAHVYTHVKTCLLHYC